MVNSHDRRTRYVVQLNRGVPTSLCVVQSDTPQRADGQSHALVTLIRSCLGFDSTTAVAAAARQCSAFITAQRWVYHFEKDDKYQLHSVTAATAIGKDRQRGLGGFSDDSSGLVGK